MIALALYLCPACGDLYGQVHICAKRAICHTGYGHISGDVVSAQERQEQTEASRHRWHGAMFRQKARHA